MSNSSESTNTGESSTQANSSNSSNSSSPPKLPANQAPAESPSECTSWRKDSNDTK